MIKDSNDNEITYWPMSLIEGEESEVITITVEGPAIGKLYGTDDDRIIVWVREKGIGAMYQNPATDPIPISLLIDTEYEVYVEALTGVEGLERVPVNVIFGNANPAGWL